MRLLPAGGACAFGGFAPKHLEVMIASPAGQRTIGCQIADLRPDAPNLRGRTGPIRRWARCLESTHPNPSQNPRFYARLLAAIVAVHFCRDRVQIVTIVNHANRPRIRSFATRGEAVALLRSFARRLRRRGAAGASPSGPDARALGFLYRIPTGKT